MYHSMYIMYPRRVESLCLAWVASAGYFQRLDPENVSVPWSVDLAKKISQGIA